MPQKVQPQGLKSNGKPKSLRVTDDGYLKIDMTDATVVAEFTPGSTVKLTDGTNDLVINSDGSVNFTPLTNLIGALTSPGEGSVNEQLSTVQPLKIVTKDITSADLTANAYTFSEAVDAVAVKNDGTSDLTITISTLLFTIKPGESRIIELAAFTVVTYSALAVFRMNGLQRGG